MKLILLFILTSLLSAGQLSSDGGRFVFGQISDFRSDQYLLDTQTGRMWKMVMTSDSTKTLEPVLFTDYDKSELMQNFMKRNEMTLTPYRQQGK